MKLQQSKNLFMILLLMVGTLLSAQSDKMNKHERKGKDMSIEERAQMRTDRLVKSLELNEEQAAKIYEINLREINNMKEKRVENKEMRKEKEDQVDSEFKEILTPEQYELFLTSKDKKKRKMRQKKANHNGMK